MLYRPAILDDTRRGKAIRVACLATSEGRRQARRSVSHSACSQLMRIEGGGHHGLILIRRLLLILGQINCTRSYCHISRLISVTVVHMHL